MVVARARDPYFPPWPDVVQLNAFAPAARTFLARTLIDIAEQADGVRCDMAMLLLDDVFTSTWGERAGEPLGTPLWIEVLDAVRLDHPDFAVVAEAYWGREPDLLAQGFDACYDKTLYDRLVGATAGEVRAHLAGMDATNAKTVRFLENHDEPRAAATVQPEGRDRAASVALATLPGTTLWHEGQLDGRTGPAPGVPRAPAGRAAVGGDPGVPHPADRGGTERPAPRRASGPCSTPSAGRTTQPRVPAGLVVGVTGRAGPWWWSTSPTHRLRGWSCVRRRAWLAGPGRSRTRSTGRRTSGTATTWPTHGLFVDLPPWHHHVWVPPPDPTLVIKRCAPRGRTTADELGRSVEGGVHGEDHGGQLATV